MVLKYSINEHNIKWFIHIIGLSAFNKSMYLIYDKMLTSKQVIPTCSFILPNVLHVTYKCTTFGITVERSFWIGADVKANPL